MFKLHAHACARPLHRLGRSSCPLGHSLTTRRRWSACPRRHSGRRARPQAAAAAAAQAGGALPAAVVAKRRGTWPLGLLARGLLCAGAAVLQAYALLQVPPGDLAALAQPLALLLVTVLAAWGLWCEAAQAARRRAENGEVLGLSAAARLARVEVAVDRQQAATAAQERLVTKLQLRTRLTGKDLLPPLRQAQAEVAQQAALLVQATARLDALDAQAADLQALLAAQQEVSAKLFGLVAKGLRPAASSPQGQQAQQASAQAQQAQQQAQRASTHAQHTQQAQQAQRASAQLQQAQQQAQQEAQRAQQARQAQQQHHSQDGR